MGPSRRSLKRISSRRSTRRSIPPGAAAQLISQLTENGTPSVSSCIELVKGRMTVAVRIRPLFGQEIEQSQKRIVCALDERCLVFDPKNDYDESEERLPRVQGSRIISTAEKNEQFEYERVFDESCDNQKVYENTVQPLLTSFLEGYNCSVFAYGATGSGKTHTMMGHSGDRGIISLTMADLFQKLDVMGRDSVVEVQASYFEIYNENILDLLRPGKSEAKSLEIRETGKMVFISGLSHHAVETMEQILELIQEGNKRRSQSETMANSKSSRSHAIFQINLKITNKSTRTLQESKMSLIDLAGSERAAGVNKDKDRLKEGTNINKSLLSLGNCINALAENKKAHIPYRDSKLTRILKDSLGGTAITLMIANISPASGSYETTHKTLLYAQRARKIQTRTAKNQSRVALGGVTNYMSLVNNINKQLETTQNKLQSEKLQTSKLREELSAVRAELESLKKQRKVQCDIETPKTTVQSYDRRTEEIFRQYTKARNREIESISNLKLAQFKMLLDDTQSIDLETLRLAANDATATKNKIDHLVADCRIKFNPDVLAPLTSQYLYDTTQREIQETQQLFAKILQESLALRNQTFELGRFISLDNTEEPTLELNRQENARPRCEDSPPSGGLNETFSKFKTPPEPLPRSALKNGTITKQKSASEMVTYPRESVDRNKSSRVRRMLIRSESTKVLSDRTAAPKSGARVGFLRKPLWR